MIATAIGPLVGRWLIEAISWHAISFINVPPGAFVVWAASRHLPESCDPTIRGRLDFRGSALASLALAGITFAVIQAPEQGLGSPPVIAALVVGVVSAVAFVSASGEAPSRCCRSRSSPRASSRTSSPSWSIRRSAGSSSSSSSSFRWPSATRPIAAGAASLPVSALMLCSPRARARLEQRIGPRLPLTLGPLLIGLGNADESRIDAGGSYLGSVLPAVIVFGLRLSLVVAPITATVLAAADERHAGVASGVNNAVARTAGLTAVAALPLIAGLSGTDYQSPAASTDGFHAAMVACAALGRRWRPGLADDLE